ncbi:MAG: hypothetical protein ACYDCL_07680 [Myxococcales bacterium]
MRQEPDRPNVRALSWIGAVVLAIFTATLIAVAFFLQGVRRAFRPHEPPPPASLGEPRIGMVNQRLFGEDPQNPEIQRRATERLASYGWVDRDAGLVHIPIERAVELTASGVRP